MDVQDLKFDDLAAKGIKSCLFKDMNLLVYFNE